MNTMSIPIRSITRPPKYHWFGYYDKLQFDPSQRYVLGMEVDFEHRSPTAADVIKIGMVDLADGDRWTELGESRAWGWQQGCMLQWRPGSESEILWNDRDGDRFVCRLLDVRTKKRRTIPHPVYTVSPDGQTAVAPDFGRVNDMRPGYGYAGVPDAHADSPAPEASGVFRVDLDSGGNDLILSLAEIVNIPNPHDDFAGAKHWFNHLLFNPDGMRFIFLHRWRKPGQSGFGTRMFTAAPDGSDVRIVDDYGHMSHFIWRDPAHILAWAYHPSHGHKFYLFRDGSRDLEVVGADVMTLNGHCSYLPGNEWILNDTYPTGRERSQELYLYQVETGRKVPLETFDAPPDYNGEWRCDLHPRFSPDGRMIVVDSAHGGPGRQMYLLQNPEVRNRKPE